MKGYNTKFLGKKFKIEIPEVNYEIYKDILRNDDLRETYIADYTHYSVVMSKSNR